MKDKISISRNSKLNSFVIQVPDRQTFVSDSKIMCPILGNFDERKRLLPILNVFQCFEKILQYTTKKMEE